MRLRLSEQMCVQVHWQGGSVVHGLGSLSGFCRALPRVAHHIPLSIYLFSFLQSQHDAPWDKPGPGSLASGARVSGAVASACSPRKPVDGERVPSGQGSVCTDFSPSLSP